MDSHYLSCFILFIQSVAPGAVSTLAETLKLIFPLLLDPPKYMVVDALSNPKKWMLIV